MIIIRRAVAVVLVFVLLVVFVAAMGVTLAVRAFSDEKFVPDLIEVTGAIDFAYDDLLDSALTDIVNRGIDIESPSGGTQMTMKFSEPERAKGALRAFIETVLPREYVKREIEESFGQLAPYVTGRTDEFAVDLETGERILAVPDALRTASAELSIGEIISHDIVAALVREQVDELVLSTLGISVTEDEAVAAAVRIMPPDWIEQRVFEGADAIAPYLAGQTDSFRFSVPLNDRVSVVGDVLKEKLHEGDVAEKLVFDQVAGPLIKQAVGSVKVLSFEIEITPQEIESALREVAPPDWLEQQGDLAVDSVIAYVTSQTDRLELAVDLRDRKTAAIPVLRRIAEQKLLGLIADTPSCQSAAELQAALGDLSARRIPRCAPPNLNLTAMATPLLPLVLGDIDRLVATSVPDKVVYTDADFQSALGAESVSALLDVREFMSKGISLTDADLKSRLADPQARADVESLIERVRSGARWDQDDLLEALDTPEQQQSLETLRRAGGLVAPVKWLAVLLPVLLILAIAFLGGRTWPDRTIWGGAALTAVAVVFFVATNIGTGYGEDVLRREFDRQEFIAPAFRNDFPATARLIESAETRDRLINAAGAVANRFRDPARPWLVAGVLVLASGIAWRVWGGRQKATGHAEPQEQQPPPPQQAQSNAA